MSIILIAAKAMSLIIVTIAAFLALAGALGADLAAGATITECTASVPSTCLLMIM